MQLKDLQMKRALRTALFVLLLSVVGMGKMYAYDFSAVCETGQTLYYNIMDAENHYVTIVAPGGSSSSGWNGCTRPIGDIVLPESVQYEDVSYIVTSISNYAFSWCSGLTGSLTIPNSVTSIGISAFSGCSGFTGSLIIGNSVSSIGKSAFYGCSGLMGNLTIPNSVTTIGELAFYGCSGLTGSLTIPNSVTSISGGAFSGCSGFTGSLTIPNSVTSIDNSAFFGCTGWTQIVVEQGNTAYDSRGNCNAIITTNTNELLLGCKNTIIPNSVTSIGQFAFYWCIGLTGSLTIPNSVTTIGYGAFSWCIGLTGSLTIPNSVTTIGLYAFSDCSGFTGDLNIPNSVTSIGGYAFRNCSGFTGSLTIPNSVTSIGQYAFESCTGLTGSLTIPNSVTTIGYGAFFGCSGLNEAIMLGTIPSALGINAFDNSSFPIYVPYESLNDYKTATNWSDYEDRIFPMTCKTISGYGEGEDNWRFIASPLSANTTPTAIDNMISETASNYDLYRFDQSEELEWQNYKAHTNDFNLVIGQGYLYANAEDVNLIFKGNFNEDDTKDVELVYDEGEPCAGWNLVGNPFPVNTYANRSYYAMNEDGTAIEPVAVSSTTAIAPCTGVMVKAETTNETVTFSKTVPEMAPNQGNLQIALAEFVSNRDVTSTVDKAIVSFNVSDMLEKFVFDKENSQIYLPQNGKNYSIVYAEKQEEIPLNFKATKNGTFTLSVDAEGLEMDYLHLIDNLTSNDIDLLATPNYTFEAKTTDYVSRFRLVFSASGDADGDNANAPFAYIHNEEIVITADAGDAGTASLQVVDILGHICRDAMIASPNHRISTAGMTPGVYVLRLICGDNVKTQKIVID